MDAVYKLLTHDKQARIFIIDNTSLLCETDALLNEGALEIFGSAFTFTCLLHGILTNAKRISVKIESSEPSSYMAFGADANGNVQGYVSDSFLHHQYDSLKNMIGESGCIKIVYDNGADAVFTGIIDIVDDDISKNLSRYFLQSEQTQSVFHHFVDKSASGISLSRGVLVQALPFADPSLIVGWANRLQDDMLAMTEACLPMQQFLEAVFPDASVVEKYPVRRECTCDRETVIEMLTGLGAVELEWTIKGNKDIEVKCGKCGTRYVFDAEELRRMVDGKEG